MLTVPITVCTPHVIQKLVLPGQYLWSYFWSPLLKYQCNTLVLKKQIHEMWCLCIGTHQISLDNVKCTYTMSTFTVLLTFIVTSFVTFCKVNFVHMTSCTSWICVISLCICWYNLFLKVGYHTCMCEVNHANTLLNMYVLANFEFDFFWNSTHTSVMVLQ